MLEPRDEKPLISVRGRMRLGDQTRALADGVLKRAFEKGQLSREELEERSARAHAAQIRHDLLPLLEDLTEYQLIRLNPLSWRYWLVAMPAQEVQNDAVLEPRDEKPPISVRGRLRLGDQSRELAIGVLKRAFEKGQLSREELEERTGLVYAAKIRHDLRPLLEDLTDYQLVRLNPRMWQYWLD